MKKAFGKKLMFSLAALALAAGCGGSGLSRVEEGTLKQILHIGNGSEPKDLDQHTVTGVPEHRIIMALQEGLTTGDPDANPIPGAAERWDISEDGKVYTFHLRKNAKWSNGDPVTANDFLFSFRRALTPALGNEYSYMFFVVVGA
ncbi:MAG: ABC transporter substrate-binding protein, partial [Verrucomicrobiota bacterium]